MNHITEINMIRIDQISIEGFANIGQVSLAFSGIDALIAFNNYGKSNVMRAINFGISFIKAGPSQRLSLMASQQVIPINKAISQKDFVFEVSGCILGDEEEQFVYAYSFEWPKDGASKGRRIKSEVLKMKKADASKYTTYVQRGEGQGVYLPSQTGRCDKPLSIGNEELLLDKLSHFDELFYVGAIKRILGLEVIMVDTMENPNLLFRRISVQMPKETYSLQISPNSEVGFFVYSLMKMDPDRYALFKDAVISLLPSIEDFEPIEINLKAQTSMAQDAPGVPFSLPEKFYDIRVKESYNNQQTSIDLISSGSKRIFYVLAMGIGADLNQIPLMMLEELENSIHPALLQNLLMTLDGLCDHTRVLISSHSPYLIRYLDVSRIHIGIPNRQGLAIFKHIKPSKVRTISRLASEQGVSMGDYLFSLMLEASFGEEKALNALCQ